MTDISDPARELTQDMTQTMPQEMQQGSASGAASLTGPDGFLPGLRYEWGRISWPTPLQLVSQTAVVIVITVLMTLIIWGLDWFWRLLITWLVPARPL